MADQPCLFPHATPAQTPYRLGWLRAPCDLVFWEWTEGPPCLHPFRWTCWRGIKRANPSKINIGKITRISKEQDK